LAQQLQTENLLIELPHSRQIANIENDLRNPDPSRTCRVRSWGCWGVPRSSQTAVSSRLHNRWPRMSPRARPGDEVERNAI
jgi:hypothetical protein